MGIKDIVDSAVIEVIAHNEHTHPRELLSECMTNEEINNIIEKAEFESKWYWCTIEVKINYRGLVKSTYLGACSYESKENFISDSNYYNDMVEEVKQELTEELKVIFMHLKE